MMTRHRLSELALLAAVFLLPWQTRWIFQTLTLDGSPWEYGKLSLYATECLIILAFALRGWPALPPQAERPVKFGYLFLGACFVSVALGIQSSLSLGMMLHVICAFILFALLLDRRIKTMEVALAFVSGLALPALFGWFQVVSGTAPSSSWLGLASHAASTLGDSVIETESGRVLRAYGTLSHPNTFGGLLAVSLIVLAWINRQVHNVSKRAHLLPLIALTAATLIITFSRSAWLAVLSALIVLFALFLWFRKLPPRRAIPIIGIGGLAMLVTLVVFQSAIFTRFNPSVRLEAKSIAERSSELNWVDDVILKNPMTGVGVGGYTVALAEARPDDPVWAYQPVHNVFLLLFAEVGLLGFLALARWVTAIDSINYKTASTANGMFAMALGTVLLVVGLFDHYLWTDWSGLALTAVCFALMLRWSLDGEALNDTEAPNSKH